MAVAPDQKSQRADLDVNRVQSTALHKDEGQKGDAEDSGEEDPGQEIQLENAPTKKKKKSKKPKSKRGIKAPTGLEEYFADAPLTPAEYEEEQALYSPDLPFINRVLTAIQRFERTRKLTPERRDIFYKYLAYGGVEVGPNMFQSASTIDKKNMTKDELAVALSQVSIGTDKYDIGSEKALYEVDFMGCAKAFLSRRAFDVFVLETREKTVEITTTIERFLDYLYQHDVCPEYNKEVLETRDFCRRAPDELCSLVDAARLLPGDFNIACSTLFGGSYAEIYDGETYWGEEKPGEANFVGFTKELAFQIMAYAMAGAAPETVFQNYQRQTSDPEGGVSVVEIRPQTGFEITEIVPPTKACQKLYRNNSQDFRPVGIVRARPWLDPSAAPEDLTEEERQQAEAVKTAADNASPATKKRAEYTFIIEQNIQMNLLPGMRIQATLRKLSCGIWFFDEYQKIYPTFDTFIPNDLMLGYTKPRWLAGSVPFEEEQERLRVEEERRVAEEVAQLNGEEDGEDGDDDEKQEKGGVELDASSPDEQEDTMAEDDDDFEI